MKPFNLKLALEGNPICDRDGDIVTNFRERTISDIPCDGNAAVEYPYIAQTIDGLTLSYTSDGNYDLIELMPRDLFMVDE